MRVEQVDQRYQANPSSHTLDLAFVLVMCDTIQSTCMCGCGCFAYRVTLRILLLLNAMGVSGWVGGRVGGW